MASYKKGTPEYKAYKQGKDKRKKPSGLDQFLEAGGLGFSGLLISQLRGKKKKS